MKLETCTYADRFEAVFFDRLTSADLSGFRELLAQIKQCARSLIVFDLANLHWIDSSGLGMLLLAKDATAKGDTKLILRSPKGEVNSLLKLGRFDKIFDIQHS